MTFDPALAVKLETAVYADEFMGDFDRLLKITGTTLRLLWTGTRNRGRVELTLCKGKQFAPLALYDTSWTGMRWAAGVEWVEDFRERLIGLLQLHKAEVGLGISPTQQIARFNVGFPAAPRLKDTDRPLSRRVMVTRRCPPGRVCWGEYEPSKESA
jgi:hypothetical protein